MIVGVACEGLDKSWLGRIIDQKAFEELYSLSKKFKFHLGGEGGEFETLVLDAPFFRKGIKIEEDSVEWKGDSGIYQIKKASIS
jgi:uncharacterized protein (TIGR00290 family)